MRRNGRNRIQVKRAVATGLFLGVFWCLAACKEPTVPPEATGTPLPTATAEGVPTPVPAEPTKAPVISDSPDKPTPTPVPAPSVSPTAAALPTEKPTATPTAVPAITEVVTPTPEALPTVEPTPEISMTPTPAPTVSPTGEPEVTPTEEPATPTPEPTGQPAYDTLIQNGWQRTEDFFGNREIFFSGRFDRTELIAVPGRYEYRYTASSDAGILFSVIGEENAQIQHFLDELAQGMSECIIEREAEEDYRYRYMDGDVTVSGRIYACGTEGIPCRMRIEFRMSGAGELPAEGYEFYLKETIKGER